MSYIKLGGVVKIFLWRMILTRFIFFILTNCAFLFLLPAKAGLFSNPKANLREAMQNQRWDEAYKLSQSLLESEAPDSQKDLYRLVQAMVHFKQGEVDESVEDLLPINEKSTYFPWAKIFLSRLAYISEDEELLNRNVEELSKLKIKGDINLEKKFYEAHLLVQNKNWSAAEKLLKSIERSSRSTELYSSVLEAQALVEGQKLKKQSISSPSLCKILKSLYVKIPQHPWVKDSAPEIKNVSIGGKKITCAVTDADFEKRRKTLNLSGDFSVVESEMQKWFEIRSIPEKKRDLILAQQLMTEGHSEEALVVLKEAQSSSSDVEILIPMSFAAARGSDLKTAIEISQKVYHLLGSSKKGIMALYQAAVWSYQIRDYENAEILFKKIKPQRLSRTYQKDLQWYLGWIRYLKGDYIASEKSFRTMLKARSKKASKENKDRIWYWLAMSLLNRGKTENAKMIFEKLNHKKGVNYYSFLARERLKQIPTQVVDESKKESSLDVIVGGKFNYMTSQAEYAPEPLMKDSELASNESESGDSDELAETVAEDERANDSKTEEDKGTETQEVASKDAAKGSDDDTKNAEPLEELFSQAEANQKLERAKSFWLVGLDELARQEVSDLEHYRASFDVLKKIMDQYNSLGLYNKLSSMASHFTEKAELSSNKDIFESVYPKAFDEAVEKASKETNVAKSLIWGIMKAESMYRPWVRSPVGAMGLMQVMPSTGYKLAEILDFKNFSPQVLLQPQEAIRFGSKYLERLGKKFDHSVQLVAAAYNAGPHRVSQWLYYFGYMQMDEWVEHIPFQETRNYVKRVTVNFMAYKDLYGESQSEGLALIGPVPVQVAGAPESKESWD